MTQMKKMSIFEYALAVGITESAVRSRMKQGTVLPGLVKTSRGGNPMHLRRPWILHVDMDVLNEALREAGVQA